MAEQLVLHQLDRNGAAIDRYKRLPGARAEIVNCSREHFLACAGFSRNQHAGAVTRDRRNFLELIDKRRALTQKLLQPQLLLQMLDDQIVLGHARYQPRKSR